MLSSLWKEVMSNILESSVDITLIDGLDLEPIAYKLVRPSPDAEGMSIQAVHGALRCRAPQQRDGMRRRLFGLWLFVVRLQLRAEDPDAPAPRSFLSDEHRLPVPA